MHPGFHGWWRARAHHGCRDAAFDHPFHGHHGHGHHGGHEGRFGAWASPGFDEGGVLGVRRPLRFLAYRLDLSEAQVSAFAAILDDLKTERAQAAVDQRRRISALAEAIEGTDFDADRVASAGDEQQRSEERVRSAVSAALRKMHAALDDEQRKKLAYLLRTGALAI
ncbi:MAG: Spy/CpxP family protein refolding chaperone [Polyangiales bacterium]